MREKGKSEEEIAADFFVSVNVVKQRLKLAAVSATLLDAYAEEEMTLDQLMALPVNPDHERREQVWKVSSPTSAREHFAPRNPRIHRAASGEVGGHDL